MRQRRVAPEYASSKSAGKSGHGISGKWRKFSELRGGATWRRSRPFQGAPPSLAVRLLCPAATARLSCGERGVLETCTTPGTKLRDMRKVGDPTARQTHA